MFVILDKQCFDVNLPTCYCEINLPGGGIKSQRQKGHLLELNVRNWIFTSVAAMNYKRKSLQHSLSISSPFISSLLNLLAVFYGYTWEFDPIYTPLSISWSVSFFLCISFLISFYFFPHLFLLPVFSVYSLFYSCCNSHLTFPFNDYFITRPQLPGSVSLQSTSFSISSQHCESAVFIFNITIITSGKEKKRRKKTHSNPEYNKCDAILVNPIRLFFAMIHIIFSIPLNVV